MTSLEILNAAVHGQNHPTRGGGSFVLSNRIKVVHKRTKIVYEVDEVDVKGQMPNSIHIVELNDWFSATNFDLARPISKDVH